MIARAAALATLALACRNGAPHAPPPPPPIAADAAPSQAAVDPLAPALLAARVAELAAPSLRGRGGGTADEAAAADKLAGWLRAAGVEPAGVDGYLSPFAYPGGKSQNVIGIIRGRSPGAGHVVIGAHYDHLGADGPTIYPGADDNASGAVGLVAIASALAQAEARPARTVVVVGFGAEELGLHGSRAYVADPALPLADAAFMINLDMIGRARFMASGELALFDPFLPDDAIGALTSPDGAALVDPARAGAAAAGRPLVAASDFGRLEGMIRPLIEQRGDHASFAAAGVPYLWLSTSMHDDYHRPTDTADKVDPATIAAVATTVLHVVAHGPDRAALRPAPIAR